MNNKICLLADIHLGVRKNKEIFLKSQKRFFEDVLVPYLKSNDIETICILGDLFDNRNSLNVMVKNEAFKLFNDILKDFHIYLIVGNHDTYFNSSIEVNSLKFFGKFDNVTLVEKTSVVNIKNHDIFMVPWIIDEEQFLEDVKNTSGKYDLCFGHFDINGCKMNKVKSSEGGIQRSVFSEFKKVFSGHFHTRSSQISNGCEIVYVGSPYQFNRGDMDEDRGFVILDLESLEYEYVNNDSSIKFIEYNYPETVNVNNVEGNLIDVYVDTASDFKEKEIEKYVKKIEDMNPADVPKLFTYNSSEDSEKFNLTIKNISSIPEMMKNYVETLSIHLKEEVNDYLLELYSETRGEDDG